MRLSVAIAVGCLSLTALSATPEVKAAIRQSTNIPAQGLGTALQTLAQQRDFQVVYLSDAVDQVHTSGAVGELTTAEALSRLLSGTGLAYQYLDEKTVTVFPIPSSSASRDGNGDLQSRRNGSLSPLGSGQGSESLSRAEGNESIWHWFRIAQADTSETPNRNAAESQELPAPEETGKGIPEILVKGRRTMNADIRRTEDDPQPYVVFGQEDIGLSNATSVEEFLKTRLPMNTLDVSNSQRNSNLGNQSTINLRGLGANQTLVLVDGRRMTGATLNNTFQQPDLNGIPLAAIERIEVLPATASGIYGGGATGGVVNIITRRDYAGVDISGTYGNTFDGDLENYRFDGSAGFELEEGRTHVLLAASHSGSDALFIGERDFVARARERLFNNNPAAFHGLATPPQGHTTNIRSVDGSNLVLDDGTPLNSPRTFVPDGYAGPASDGGAALVANAGQYNLQIPDSGQGAQRSITTDPTVSSASLNLRREFTEWFEAYADLSWIDDESTFFVCCSIPPGNVTLAATAPNNPFTTAIRVNYPTVGLVFPTETDIESLRAAGGVIVRLPGDWTAAADYVWGRARLESTSAFAEIGDPDGTGPGISADQALANGTLNVMRDLNAFPLDFSPYRLPFPGTITGPSDTLLDDATLRLSGPTLQLPAGPLALSGHVSYRKEETKGTYQDLIFPNATRNVFFFPQREQEVYSLYAEARAPFVSQAADIPLVRALELQASVRYDEYTTRAPSPSLASGLPSRDAPLPEFTYSDNKVDATAYTLGLRYEPIADITLRGSYATGFLPPSVTQIVPNAPNTAAMASLIDPRRGNVLSTINFTNFTGGNPDLEPEDSESWSVGAIFSPSFLPDLRFSVDYTRIEKSNEIAVLSAQQVLDLESILPGRIVRAALTPEDQALGYTGGVITSIDNRSVNVSNARIEAFDLQVDYQLRTHDSGTFHFYVVGTHQPHFERQIVPDSSFIDFAGFTSGPLEWRGNGGLRWESGSWTLNWSAQYYDSYLVYSATATPASIATATLNQGSAKIPSQTYHDVTARYRFDKSAATGFGILANAEVVLGIQNVFDESPPIVATTSAFDGYSFYGDPRRQRFTLSVKKTF